MKLIKALFILLTPLLILGSANAQDSLSVKTNEIFENYLQEDGPGFSISILKNGELILEKNYGFANIEERGPITSNTKFNLASLTQQFTAMGMLILKEEGKLDFKDGITQYLDNLPDYVADITIENLLEEVSGIPYLDLRNNKNAIETPEQVIDFLNSKKKLVFKTGSKAVSNPANYALLTLILEKVSGEDYRSFVTDRIFEPLEMEDSEVYKGGWFYKVKNKALGYQNIGTVDSVVFKPVEKELNKDYMRGLTGIYSSSSDLQKWLNKGWDSEALLDRKALNQAMRINFIRGAKEYYGYGWRKAFNKGKKYLYQGGVGYGNTHILLKFPREKIDVIILSNQRAVFGLRKKAFELVNLVSEKEYDIK